MIEQEMRVSKLSKEEVYQNMERNLDTMEKPLNVV